MPTGITTGADGNLWFTETRDPGAVVRVTSGSLPTPTPTPTASADPSESGADRAPPCPAPRRRSPRA